MDRAHNLSRFARAATPLAVVLALAGVAVPALSVPLLATLPIWVLALPALLGLVLFVAAIAVWLVGRRAGAKAVAAERAWLDGLPFTVYGWWELLGSSLAYAGATRNHPMHGPTTAARRIELELRFAQQPAPPDLVQQVLRGAAGAGVEHVNVHPSTEREQQVSAGVPVSAPRDRIVAIVHAWLGDGLVALHERHPLGSVLVKGLQ